MAPVVLALAVASLAGACRGADPTVTISLTQADLQEHIERAFPYDTTRARTRMVLENPVVVLETGSDEIGLTLDIRLDPPLMDEFVSRATVAGSLRYDRSEAALYLDEARIPHLEIDRLEPQNVERVRSLAESAVGRALRYIPLYRLEGRTLTETTAEYVLRSVRVEDSALNIEIGLPRSRPGDER